ncbi:MAG: hypothetical protein AAF750_04640 [Planctomycetota bacterium]
MITGTERNLEAHAGLVYARLGGWVVVLLVGALVVGMMGCQETRRDEKRFGPPSIGGPPRSGGPGADAGERRGTASPSDVGEVAVDAELGEDVGPALGAFENPVKADGTAGQLAYLSRLRNTAGVPVDFRREGTFLRGDGVPLDGYRLTDPATENEQLVFLDLHHPGHRETRPLPGYRLVPAETAVARDEP